MSTNFFDSVVECIEYINKAEQDKMITKDDMIDSIRSRFSIMISKLSSESCYAGGTMMMSSHSIKGWAVENAVVSSRKDQRNEEKK
jgi:hypothetical protein